jgi:hypothetical protein
LTSSAAARVSAAASKQLAAGLFLRAHAKGDVNALIRASETIAYGGEGDDTSPRADADGWRRAARMACAAGRAFGEWKSQTPANDDDEVLKERRSPRERGCMGTSHDDDARRRAAKAAFAVAAGHLVARARAVGDDVARIADVAAEAAWCLGEKDVAGASVDVLSSVGGAAREPRALVVNACAAACADVVENVAASKKICVDGADDSNPPLGAEGAEGLGDVDVDKSDASSAAVVVNAISTLIAVARSAVTSLPSGAFSFTTLVPVRTRPRGERRSLRTLLPGVTLRPPTACNPDTPRRLSTPLLTPFNSTPTSLRTDPRPSDASDDARETTAADVLGDDTARVCKALWASRCRDMHAKHAKTHASDLVERRTRTIESKSEAKSAKSAKARSIHWSPYDRVRVVNADP